ncbi:MAG: TonB-dependent receptor [Spirosomataceae bacterium]
MKLLLSLLLAPVFLMAQPAVWVIKGKVQEPNQSPIPFATVYINNTSIVTTADDKGAFSLSVPLRFKKVELVASFVGYTSVKKTIEQLPKPTPFYTLELASANKLAEVKVMAKMERDWRKRWRIFERGLKGDSPLTNDCIILNPEVVRLGYDSLQKQVTATATEPIILQNNAFGLKILFQLESFHSDGEKTFFSGNKFFQSIPSENDRIKSRQTRTRDVAYRNSFRHFLVSLANNQLTENGFEVYAVRQMNEVYRTRIPFSGELASRNFRELKATDICYRDEKTGQYLLQSESLLFIFALNSYNTNSIFFDRPQKYSRLFLPRQYLTFNENGWITAPNGMVLYDYWGQEGLANLLPSDYLPSDIPVLDSLVRQSPTPLSLSTQLPSLPNVEVPVPSQGVQYERGKTMQVQEQTPLVKLDYEVKLVESDYGLSVFELLRRIPGLRVSFIHGDYSIAFTGNFAGFEGQGNSTPALELDGVFTDNPETVMEILKSLPVRQIQKIGAVKYGNSAVYGARGGTGTIVIQTVK